MTEFVIVIPIILLFFFAMLQYFADVRASQLGNYAAYMAARVYAVNKSVDSSGAQDTALNAAAMVLGPIAAPAPGELSLGGLVPNIPILNTLMGNEAGKYFIGYGFARYGRFGMLGGSVSNNVTGNPQQVDTIINYPQPIFVPGLAAMWNLVTGDKIYSSMQPLAQGLSGAVQTYNKGMGEYEQAQVQAAGFGIKLPDLPTIFLPYINIQSKCSIGYANWQKYNDGPRLPPTGSDTDSTGTSTKGQDGQQSLQKSQQDQQNYQAAVSDAKKKCDAYCTAKSDLSAAHGRDDGIIAKGDTKDNPGYNDAVADLAKYQNAYDAANSANSAAQSKLASAKSAVEQDTGQSLNDMPCNCP